MQLTLFGFSEWSSDAVVDIWVEVIEAPLCFQACSEACVYDRELIDTVDLVAILSASANDTIWVEWDDLVVGATRRSVALDKLPWVGCRRCSDEEQISDSAILNTVGVVPTHE